MEVTKEEIKLDSRRKEEKENKERFKDLKSQRLTEQGRR